MVPVPWPRAPAARTGACSRGTDPTIPKDFRLQRRFRIDVDRASDEEILRAVFYVTVSGLARAGQLRNGAPELSAMHITESDVAPLAAFLRALNEDYE
jgi:hypothetical protein